MKHGRVISLKNPLLRNLRNNLRKVIAKAQYSLQDVLSQRGSYLSGLGVTLPRDKKRTSEFHRIIEEQFRLRTLFAMSICYCKSCNKGANRDMVYHGKFKAWYCVNCFRVMERKCDPSNSFNKGVIVKVNNKKPCWDLGECPYGTLFLNFRERMFNSEFTCRVHEHDCPVFYVSEKVNEYSNSFTPSKKREMLKDNLKNWPGWIDKERITNSLEKPCLILSDRGYEWCPYGSLGDPFKKREITNKYQCKVFPHDCPIYYLIPSIGENFINLGRSQGFG